MPEPTNGVLFCDASLLAALSIIKVEWTMVRAQHSECAVLDTGPDCVLRGLVTWRRRADMFRTLKARARLKVVSCEEQVLWTCFCEDRLPVCLRLADTSRGPRVAHVD